MKPPKQRIACACGCGRKFFPRVRTHIYFEMKCKNREASRRLRERAKMYTELQAETMGALGGTT